MDIGSIFLILALFILTSLYVGRPLYDHSARRVTSTSSELSALLAERDRVLNALSELDFDHALGKIPAEDYPIRRKELAQRGAMILRQLDEQGGALMVDPTSKRLEEATNNASLAAQDDALEAMIAQRRRARKETSGGFCPQCGGSVVHSDHFCPKCGTELS